MIAIGGTNVTNGYDPWNAGTFVIEFEYQTCNVNYGALRRMFPRERNPEPFTPPLAPQQRLLIIGTAKRTVQPEPWAPAYAKPPPLRWAGLWNEVREAGEGVDRTMTEAERLRALQDRWLALPRIQAHVDRFGWEGGIDGLDSPTFLDVRHLILAKWEGFFEEGLRDD